METAVFHLFCVLKFQCTVWSIIQGSLGKKKNEKKLLERLEYDLGDLLSVILNSNPVSFFE